MTELIAEENREKFHQTYNCPLFQQQILDDLGLLGDGPEVVNVLNGTYNPTEGTSWATRRWLQHMTISDPTPRSEITTSLKECRQGWNKVNEKNASGELNMGHFKAAAMHSRLGWMNFVMAVLPYTAGKIDGGSVQMLCFSRKKNFSYCRSSGPLSYMKQISTMRIKD